MFFLLSFKIPIHLHLCKTSCRLEACLEEYTRLEMLTDCICRKCSVLATHKRLLEEMKSLQEALAPQPSPTPETPFEPGSPLASSSTPAKRAKVSNSKKKRYREVKKMEKKVKVALEEGRIEDESFLEGVRVEKVVSPASTKQAMIARVSVIVCEQRYPYIDPKKKSISHLQCWLYTLTDQFTTGNTLPRTPSACNSPRSLTSHPIPHPEVYPPIPLMHYQPHHHVLPPPSHHRAPPPVLLAVAASAPHRANRDARRRQRPRLTRLGCNGRYTVSQRWCVITGNTRSGIISVIAENLGG